MPVKPVLIAVTLLFFVGHAGGMAADSTGLSGTDDLPDSDQELPSDDMLDFLGQWETEKGQWVDPGDLDWLMQPGDGQNDDD